MASFDIRSKFIYGTFLSIITIFATSYAYDKIVLLGSRPQYEALLETAQTCSKQIGIPAAALKQIIDWPMEDSRASKEFFQCVCYNTGYTDTDGHFVIDSFLALIVKNGTKEDVVERMTDCNKVTLDDPVETAFAMGDCAHKFFIFGVDKKDN